MSLGLGYYENSTAVSGFSHSSANGWHHNAFGLQLQWHVALMPQDIGTAIAIAPPPEPLPVRCTYLCVIIFHLPNASQMIRRLCGLFLKRLFDALDRRRAGDSAPSSGHDQCEDRTLCCLYSVFSRVVVTISAGFGDVSLTA